MDLDDFGAATLTAQARFPLLVICTERSDGDTVHVGRIVVATDKAVQVRLISPMAKWIEGTTSFPVADITRVCFGGDYEGALAMMSDEMATTS